MDLKPCPFCGSKVDVRTKIGYMCPGCIACATISCPTCKNVSQQVSHWDEDIVKQVPHLDVPLESRKYSFHPTIKKAIRPIIIKQVSELWEKRC
jgi:hypothetical protein